MGRPWDGAIPEDDLAAFAGGAVSIERPMEVGERPAVIVVDMTRAFVDSAYPTGWSPTGRPAAEANVQLVAAARAAAVPVYFTNAYADPHYEPTAAERGRWKPSQTRPAGPDLPPGDVIVEALTPAPGDVVIHKGTKPSAFFGTPLASLLIAHGVDTTIVTGMTTSGCVRATAIDAFQHNYHVLVPHEACADRSQISHRVTLFDLHLKYADVVSLDEAIGYLARCGVRDPAVVGNPQTAPHWLRR